MPILTKSLFKTALECPTQLYYASNKKEYANQNNEDPFLKALAEGGYQVGELAKYLFCNDPVADNITIHELDIEKALLETAARRKKMGRVLIAEAAFRSGALLVRADIMEEYNDHKEATEGNPLNIHEVKSKSYDGRPDFFDRAGKGPNTGKIKGIAKEWAPYLYDIAFQKWVVKLANPGRVVKAHVILPDKRKTTTVDGMNNLFRIEKDGNRYRVKVAPGTTQLTLGDIPLHIQNVDQECEWIYENPVTLDMYGTFKTFKDFIDFLLLKLEKNERIWSTHVDSKCQQCPFNNPDLADGRRSGFHECWTHHSSLTHDELNMQPLVLDLWGGKSGSKSIKGHVLKNKRYLLSEIKPADYTPNNWVSPSLQDPMDATERRRIQLDHAVRNDFNPFLKRVGLRSLFQILPDPYHFIDFETTMVPIPFQKGQKPFGAIAFQYSYHLMDRSGAIRHKGQYLSFESGKFPNYDFLRSLKNDLDGVKGTIFRYHMHENNYLNHLHAQLKEADVREVPDRAALMQFIQSITIPPKGVEDAWTPTNAMHDLYEYVLRYFYSLHAKGSNSIKDILPAIIKSSEYLQTKYGKAVYATKHMPSINWQDPHIWIDPAKDYNPYKTLPALFSHDVERYIEERDSMKGGLEEISNGGAAMMAYSFLQYTELPDATRKEYRDALYRYCELDTFAMAMIWDYFGHEIGYW